jgi:hypothetical protein
MNEVATIEVEDRPLWLRVIQFPLVAMIFGALLWYVAIVVGALMAAAALPSLSGFTLEMSFDVFAAPFLILFYKLGIQHLGEHPRDDLRMVGAARPLLAGLVAGFAVFSLAVAIAAAIGVYRITGEGDSSGLVAALLGPALFAAVSEEMLFRGILFRWIEEFGGSWAALIVTSILFGAVHLRNPNASLLGAAGIALEAGVLLGAAYMLTRSLWLPMGIHAGWNFTQGEIFDIPVSGTHVHGVLAARLSGSPLLTGNGFGLEASPIAMAVATGFGLWLLWLAIRRGELVQPWWVRRRVAMKDRPPEGSALPFGR